MSSNNSMDQRKKLLEDALNAHENYEKSLKQIESLKSRLSIAEKQNKNAEKLVTENTKLKEVNKALKSSINEVEKRCESVQNEVKNAVEKTSVLKAEIHRKDMALNKYKSRALNGDHKGMDTESNELRHLLHEKEKLVEILRDELQERERLFVGADNWNRSCSKEKKALLEEVNKLKDCQGNADAFGKILSLEEVIVDRERELKTAKELNEQLAVHIYSLEAKICEIPKLESKIRVMELEIEGYKKSGNGFESFFSKPPPTIGSSIINHPLNVPPPQAQMFAKTVEPPKAPAVTQNQLSDLEKQMQIMANEISRLKRLSDNAENYSNGKKA